MRLKKKLKGELKEREIKKQFKVTNLIDFKNLKWYQIFFLEVVIKIEVKDNNIEQALRVLKRKLQRDGFFKVIKLKNTYEKPSEKKKRILQENIKRVKKLNKLKNRI